MIKPIIYYPNDILRTKCVEVTDINAPEIKQLIIDLEDTLRASDGIGLAAPQIGSIFRVISIKTSLKLKGLDGVMTFINPVVLGSSGVGSYEEGCLSVPGARGRRSRALAVQVGFIADDGRQATANSTGIDAICLQHEIDHLDSKMYFDVLPSSVRQGITRKSQKWLKSKG